MVMHEKDGKGLNDVDIETLCQHTGWAVFSGADGDEVHFIAYFDSYARAADATFWIASGTRATSAHYLPSWREFEENLNQSVSDNSSCPDGVDDPFEFREGAEEAFTSMLEDWAEKYMAEAAALWNPGSKPPDGEPCETPRLTGGRGKS